MSYTSLKVINPGSSSSYTEVAEYRNSHGFAPFVWSLMGAHYLGDPHGWLLSEERARTLWDLVKQPAKVPPAQRAVMGMTFDWVVIPRESITRAIADIMAFLGAFPVSHPQVEGRVNHLPAIANDLRRVLLSHPNCLGACFYAASVGEDLWAGHYDEARDEHVPYDLNTGTKHWFLYDLVDRESTGAAPEGAPSP